MRELGPTTRPGGHTSTRCKKRYQGLGLLTDAELLNDDLVTIGVVRLEVVEQAAAPADHHEQATPRRVVLAVGSEVLRQLVDPFAEDGNLHFRTARVRVMRAELRNDARFVLSRYH